MKKIIYILLAAAGLAACWSCSKEEAPAVEQGITGEWHLETWNDNATGEDFDLYLELGADGSFNSFERIVTSVFVRYSGTYTATGGVITGTYSDGELWATYSYELSDGDKTLTLTSNGKEKDVHVFSRTDIPGEVRDAADALTKSGSAPAKFF